MKFEAEPAFAEQFGTNHFCGSHQSKTLSLSTFKAATEYYLGFNPLPLHSASVWRVDLSLSRLN